MSLYGPGNEQASKSGFTCGRQLPGAAVGQPHVQAVQCKNRQFEIILGHKPHPNGRTPIVTHCVSCHGQDHMQLLMTNAGDDEGMRTAQQFPALLQQNANPNMLVCNTCPQFRFQLLDEGNEVKRRCVYCGDTRHLGYETKAGDTSTQRTFG